MSIRFCGSFQLSCKDLPDSFQMVSSFCTYHSSFLDLMNNWKIQHTILLFEETVVENNVWVTDTHASKCSIIGTQQMMRYELVRHSELYT